MDMSVKAAEVFDGIYRTNAWGGRESRSGPGAGDIEIRTLAPDIVRVVTELGVRSVLDVGCGECYWTPELPGYIGIDVSQEALSVARQRHPGWDLRLDDGSPYPRCDLVMTRCVMQHLSMADGMELLGRIRDSGANWLLATSYKQGENVDIKTGWGYWPDLRVAPFDLGEPVMELVDGRTDAIPKDCVMGLWPLRKEKA